MGKQSREKRERMALQNSVENRQATRSFEARTGLEKTCLFIITWGTYLVLFTPLIINKGFFFPFVAPKTIFFRIIVEIILAAYLFLVIANRKYRPRINLLTISLTIFLGIFILTSFTGINLDRSLWSTNERMTGIFTMLHLFAFFIVLSSVLKKRQDWEKVLGVSILVGVILSLYVILADELSTRGGGTIGNTSFMAAYLLFDIFFALALLLSKRGFWQIFGGISFLIILPALLISTGRGAIVAFFLGLFLLVLGYLLFSQRKKLRRFGWIVILLLVISGISAAVFQPAFIGDKVDETLSDMKSRFVVWEAGWQGFLERPIVGWGPENFIVVFLKYYNPCMPLPECGSEVWFDRTHNIVLDTLVTTGIIGLLSYLAVFVVAIVGLLKTIPGITDRKNIFLPLSLAVMLVAYFVQNLLVFDMINTYLVFFLALALVSFLTSKPSEEMNEVKKRKVNPFLGVFIIVAVAFFMWNGNIKTAMANHYMIKYLQSESLEDVNMYFQKSLDSWMNKYETREQFSQKLKRSTFQDMSPELREALQTSFQLGEREMEKSVEQNYLDFRQHLFLGELYNNFYRISGETEKLDKASNVLQKAIQLAPTNQHGYWYLAETRLMQGRTDEAISLLKQAVDLEPRLGAARWYLAMTCKALGQYQLAKEQIDQMQGYNWWSNKSDLQKVIEVYVASGEELEVIPLFEVLVGTDEIKDAELWAGLAASYANLGHYEEARIAAQKTLEIDPDMAPQVEEFINSLPEQ